MEQGIVKYFVICESCGHVHRNTQIVNCEECGANVSAKRITAKKHINSPKGLRRNKAFTIFVTLLISGIICVFTHTILPMAAALLFVLVLISKSPVSPTLRFIAPISLFVILAFLCLPFVVYNYFGSLSTLPLFVKIVFIVMILVFALFVIYVYRGLKETEYMSRIDTNLYKYEDKTLSDDESSTCSDLTRVKHYE